LLFIFLFQNKSIGQKDTGTTKVYIVGTIHTGNKKFGHKDLYNELTNLKPDIILWEQSVPFKRVLGLQIIHFLKIGKVGIEQLALQKYTRRNADCQVLPFDTTVNNRRAYVKNLQQNTQKIYDLLAKAEKTKEDSMDFFFLVQEQNSLFADLDNKTIKEINALTYIDKTRHLKEAQEQVVLPLLKKYSTDTTLTDWYAKEQSFWNSRNIYMARQIEKIALANPQKKIVILTGLNHKYILIGFLTKMQNANFQCIQTLD
jgi:hypothetical protein